MQQSSSEKKGFSYAYLARNNMRAAERTQQRPTWKRQPNSWNSAQKRSHIWRPLACFYENVSHKMSALN